MDYSIHPMKIDDYHDVYNLWQQTEGMRLSPSDSRESIERYLQRNPELSFVACNDQNEIIGAVLCGHDGARGYIRHLAVAKNYRCHGIGKNLVEQCLNRLRILGIYKCTLFILTENEQGQQFWHHNGWMKRDDLVTMSKIL